MTTQIIPVRDDRAEFPDIDRAALFLRMLTEIGITYQSKKVVDLGTGYGSIAIAMAKDGAEVIAIDAAEGQIAELMRRAASENTIIQAYTANLLDDLSLVDDADLAIMVGVVEYAGMWSEANLVEELQVRVLRSAFRSLKPGGELILCSKNRIWPLFAFRDAHTKMPLVNILPRNLAERLTRQLSGSPYRLYIHSPNKWVSLVKEAGFKDAEVYYPYFSYQYPIAVSRKPSLAEVSSLQKPELSPELLAITYGRFWKLKASVMALAHQIGIPVSQSVVIKAIK